MSVGTASTVLMYRWYSAFHGCLGSGILAITFIVGISFEVPKQTMDAGFLLSEWGMRMQGGDGVDMIVPLNELWEMSDGKKL